MKPSGSPWAITETNMATKRKTKATPAAQRNAVIVDPRDSSDVDDALARTLTRPETQAAVTMQVWEESHEVNALARELAEQIAAANRGDLSRSEGMLMAQAHTLDALFNNLGRRARGNFDAGYLEAGDRYMRLALKSQSQCRTTLEALAEIKNPMTGAYVRQANIAAGHQQVNNGLPAGGASRVREIENQQSKLLEVQDAEWLDAGTAGATGATDKELAPLGTLDGPENRAGQGEGRQKRG